MKYKLTYRIARKIKDIAGQVGLFTENVEGIDILKRMKEIEKEHNANVEGIRALPQFAHFFPIEKV